MCGNVHIPYPFGIGDECSWKGEFTVTCNQSFSPPRPYSGDFEIISISLVAGEIRLFSPVAYICKNPANSNQSSGEVNWTFTFTNSSFLISPTHNVFMAIGCDTLAFVDGREDESFFTGCITTCKSLHDAAQDGDECTGLGCCQTGIPSNLSTISIYWSVDKNDSLTNPTWSPCSYAFVSEKGWYKFKRRDLTRVGNKSFTDRVGDRTIPMALDWALRNDGSCQLPAEDGKSSPKPTPSACASANSYCVNATQRHGYLCHCSKGYGGNPYIEGGCININECELRKSNPAKYGKLYPCHSASTCQDTPGDYKCKCNFWHRGNGKSDKGCQPIVPGYGVAIVATFVAVVLACFAGVLLQRREHRKNFSKNGGDLLQEAGINTFTKGDLEKITNSYKKKIGQGHFGQVYEGTIKGTQRVAVKRPHEKGLKGAAVPVEEFRNEIIFQFRISHENLVRLVGCCLETDVPILVFEYISRGNLQEVLHGSAGGKPPCPLSLTERLDIAIGSAKALAHMHSHGEHNHVHGDVKPANILLDGDLKPKVSDFGSSKLLSVNSYARHVAADGTYIDPVYYKTGRFTVKSDVYSFGVVLLELVTRRMARHGDNILTLDFKNSCKAHGNGREMYDPEIISSDDDTESQCYMECLDMVSALAIRCLNGDDAEERPTMGEVVVELEQAKSIANREAHAMRQAEK